MYLAASRIHTVKCIFPASLLPSSALFPWLSSSGRNPSSPQAGKTPGTMFTAHGGGLHYRARESRASHQPPPLATPPGHSPNYLVHSSFSPQAVRAGQGNPRGCCNWLKTTGPVSWFEFSLCLQRQKKKNRLNGLLILIQHRSEGFSSLTKIYHRCLAVCFNSPRGLKAGSDCVKCPRELSKGSQALCTAGSSHSPSLVYPPATDTVPSC